MKTLGRFNYVAPLSIQEATSFLNNYKGCCKVLAGGTDLFILLRKGDITTDYVVDLKRILELQKIDYDENNELHIGATCTINSLNNSGLIRKNAPVITEVVKTFANNQVRNRATIGGNIARSSPAGDMLPALLVLDARVRLIGSNSNRTVSLTEFFKGPGENILEEGEILSEVIIPSSNENSTYTAFSKVMRTSADLAKLSLAVYLEIEKGKIHRPRIAVGAVAAIPMRLSKVEKALDGEEVSVQVIKKAVEYVKEEISPITDVRSTREYRMHVAAVVVRKTLEKALQEVKQ